MRKRRIARRTYAIATWLQGISAIALLLVGAALKTDLTWVGRVAPSFVPLITGLQKSAGLTVLILTPLAGLLSWWKKEFSAPWFWNTLHHFLDTFRKDVFDGASDAAQFRHRVTLFRRTEWAWTGFIRFRSGGWIKPVERSGYTTHRTSTVFRASDTPNESEGVAGQAWSQNCVLLCSNLPDCSREAHPSSEQIAEYARRTYVTTQWVNGHRPRSRSLLAIPIEVKSEPWGVVVLDSVDPFILDNVKQQSYQLFAKYLGKLLERA